VKIVISFFRNFSL